ncbi:cysteine/serine-rich nuclear protein 1 isoform X1 [Gadus morhua]|uniref:Cysteine and serine rich nuclear protein 1 n=2 Tax=Gadus morhua TaxID=8049 RepID=A0A8C5BA79_GADMO|nr:cysteine/serine-rich nuclear protein 1-like isoform X1 [Gadus morhua]
MTIDRPDAEMRGVLKRRFAEVEEEASYVSSSPSSSSSSSPLFSSEWESDGENQLILPAPRAPAQPASAPIGSFLSKWRRADGRGHNVRFDTVTVFHFPRCQGFVSVPSHGGASLGMVWNHSALHRYTLEEHAAARQRRHRERLLERLREDRLERWRNKLVTSGALDRSEADRLTVDQLPGGYLEVPMEHPAPDGGIWSLQPYSYRQRQALLRGAGVKHVDREEKRQLHSLRLSREACGCDCRGFCEPETCACSLAGIKCQMDRSSFPCGCSMDSCGNSQGRSEFNPGRVKTHYLHTAMRLHLEGRRPPGAANNHDDQREVPGRCGEDDRRGRVPERQTRQDGCPFGFSTEEEEEGGLLFPSVPPTTSTAFCLTPEPSELGEEGSSGGDTMDSSFSSSDLDAAEEGADGTPRRRSEVTEETGPLSCVLSRLDPQRTHCNATEDDLQHMSSTRPLPASPLSDPASPLEGAQTTVVVRQDEDSHRTPSPSTSSTSTGYLDENANEATDFFGEDSLEKFPDAALFTANSSCSSSSNGYVDLSVSSDSDLEFFDSDYLTCGGQLHNSFKGGGSLEGLRHLQTLTSCSLPQYPETPVCLLESLIGSSSEPIAEDAHMVTFSQLLEVLQ